MKKITDDKIWIRISNPIFCQYSFQLPKLSFLLSKSGEYVRNFKIIDIGLSQDYINDLDSKYFYFTEEDYLKKIKIRPKFSHKGTFGHSLLIGGNKDKLGAIILAAKGCLRSGSGLLTIHTSWENIQLAWFTS